MASSRYVLFLGGPFSGLLTAIALDRPDLRVLPWFCLVPLFYSLQRHAGRSLLRLGHGLGFGLVLCTAELSWVAAARAGDAAGAWDSVVAGLKAAGVWGSFCAWWATFCLVAGPVLRLRRSPLRWLLLPLLWSGLEVARGTIGSPWVSPWLPVGTLLSPPVAESQVASIVGVYGLSFALAFWSTMISELLHSTHSGQQIRRASIACVAPLLCFGYGCRDWAPAATGERLSVLVVSHAGEELPTLSRLSLGLASALPTCILWPYIPVQFDESSRTLEVPADVRSVADALSSLILGGAPPGMEPRIPLAIDRVGRRLPALPTNDAVDIAATSSLRIFEAGGSYGGLGLGFEMHTSSTARVLTQNGATFLLASAGTRPAWPAWVLEREARLLAFRALENRRWLAVSASSWAAVFAPNGEATFRLLAGVEGAGTETIEALTERSVYNRWGWWFEPTALLAAFWLTLQALWQRRSSPASGPEVEHREAALPRGEIGLDG